jgi:hypothetical protein
LLQPGSGINAMNFLKTFVKKIYVFDTTLLNFAKMDQSFVFKRKNAIFSAENRLKWPKVVIITLAPGSKLDRFDRMVRFSLSPSSTRESS